MGWEPDAIAATVPRPVLPWLHGLWLHLAKRTCERRIDAIFDRCGSSVPVDGPRGRPDASRTGAIGPDRSLNGSRKEESDHG